VRRAFAITIAIAPLVAFACGQNIALEPGGPDGGAGTDGSAGNNDDAGVVDGARDATPSIPLGSLSAGTIFTAANAAEVRAIVVSSPDPGTVFWASSQGVFSCPSKGDCAPDSPVDVDTHSIALGNGNLFWTDDSGLHWVATAGAKQISTLSNPTFAGATIASGGLTLFVIKKGTDAYATCDMFGPTGLVADGGANACKLSSFTPPNTATALTTGNGRAFVALSDGSITVLGVNPQTDVKGAQVDPTPASSLAVSGSGTYLYWGYQGVASIARAHLIPNGVAVPDKLPIDGPANYVAAFLDTAVFWATSDAVSHASFDSHTGETTPGLSITAVAITDTDFFYADSTSKTIYRRPSQP
jgi:hypothetical protein